uniref:poly(A)-specific ribonuclease n=1 Tax=Mola mola TaxID=94237 RepID=A0A3Q4B5L5_MOLML
MPAATVDHSQRICEVWADNLEEELKRIRHVIRKYNYIAMDTEFPGVVARPIGEFRSNADYQYQLLRCNVDLLKIIQLGLTFMNEQGEYPPGTSTWQFNFKFNLTEDMYAQDSIELLTTSGIQFKKHEDEGIETLYFAELLMTSGVVLCDGVKWLSFHSGYDFGYLIKILSNANLPEEEVDFFEILRLYFPVIYDVKYLMKSCKNLKGGLQEVAEQLELERIGPQHQAGSDSLLTGMAFFKMREVGSSSQLEEKDFFFFFLQHTDQHQFYIVSLRWDLVLSRKFEFDLTSTVIFQTCTRRTTLCNWGNLILHHSVVCKGKVVLSLFWLRSTEEEALNVKLARFFY